MLISDLFIHAVSFVFSL